MSDLKDAISPGVYRHFKGGLYEVLGVASDADSPEQFVVYRALYGNHSLFIRRARAFFEVVTTGTDLLPRFSRVDQPAAELAR